MFRAIFALAIIFASGGAISATDFPDGSGIVGHGGQNPADHAARASEDHLRSQLDWRSYYLNRMGGRHERQSQFRGTWQQAPAAPN
jgi:hypothetical protein